MWHHWILVSAWIQLHSMASISTPLAFLPFWIQRVFTPMLWKTLFRFHQICHRWSSINTEGDADKQEVNLYLSHTDVSTPNLVDWRETPPKECPEELPHFFLPLRGAIRRENHFYSSYPSQSKIMMVIWSHAFLNSEVWTSCHFLFSDRIQQWVSTAMLCWDAWPPPLHLQLYYCYILKSEVCFFAFLLIKFPHMDNPFKYMWYLTSRNSYTMQKKKNLKKLCMF